tara:strand:- start:2693 stop:4084 length:1392 start_codon:yes stop_codon:yes gene_type:complete
MNIWDILIQKYTNKWIKDYQQFFIDNYNNKTFNYINNLTYNKNIYNENIYDILLKLPNCNWGWEFLSIRISISFIEKYFYKFPWSKFNLLMNRTINSTFIEKFGHYLDEEQFTYIGVIDFNFIFKTANIYKWNWKCQSSNPHLTLNIVKDNLHLDWCWNQISSHKNITWDDIIENLDLPWNFSYIAFNPNVNFDIIYNNYAKYSWCSNVNHNPTITIDTIYKYLDFNWNWDKLSTYDNFTWDIIISNSHLPWNWNHIIYNRNITWEILVCNLNIKWYWPIYSDIYPYRFNNIYNILNLKTINTENTDILLWKLICSLDIFLYEILDIIVINYQKYKKNNFSKDNFKLIDFNIILEKFNNHFKTGIKWYWNNYEFDAILNENIIIDNLNTQWLWACISNNEYISFIYINEHLDLPWDWNNIQSNEMTYVKKQYIQYNIQQFVFRQLKSMNNIPDDIILKIINFI